MNKINLLILVLLLGLVGFVYWPVLSTEFGMHNDYSLLAEKKDSLYGFPEANQLLLMGRAIGGALITLHAWTIEDISHFIPSRLVSLLLALVSSFLFYRYVRTRTQLKPFWCAFISAAIIFLPSTQLYVIWLTNLVPGTLSVLLAILIYFLWDAAWSAKNFLKWAGMLLSFILFVGLLFIYPLTALSFLIFPFCLTLFRPLSEWMKTRMIILRDVIFVGFAMILYRIIDQKLIQAWALKSGQFDMYSQPEYNTGIVDNLLSKWELVREIFLYSFAGTWHLCKGIEPAILPIVLCLLGVCYLMYRSVKSAQFQLSWLLQAIVSIVILFLIVNCPMILAKNYVQVMGYRVIHVSLVMALILQMWVMCNIEKQFVASKIPLRVLTSCIVLGMALVTFWNLSSAALNYNRELNYIRDELKRSIALNPQRYVYVRPPRGESLIGRPMPFEFGFMITDIEHITAVFTDASKRLNVILNARLYVIDHIQKLRFYPKPTDFVIDMDEAVREQ